MPRKLSNLAGGIAGANPRKGNFSEGDNTKPRTFGAPAPPKPKANPFGGSKAPFPGGGKPKLPRGFGRGR